MSFYDEMALLVIEMLAEYGAPVELRRTLNNGTVQTFTVQAIFLDPVSHRLHPVEMNPLDKRFVCDNRVPIQMNDAILRGDGKRLILTRIEEMKPADVVLGYKAEMRYG